MPTENFSPNDELGNPQETTPITSQPQSQTVDEYYSNLATTAEANRDKIQELGEKSAALNEELSQQEKRLNTAEEAYKKSTGIFQGIASDVLQKKEELKTNLVRSQAERTDNKLKAEESTLRNEYYGQTGNTKDFLRATDPTRLREIAIANQLNESQGPSIRVSDMTAEQIQERKEFLEQQKALRESGIETKMPLPERESLEQKEARYDQDAVEAFSSSITSILEQMNDGYEKDSFIAPEYRRKITSEEGDIKAFTKAVYDERKELGAFGIRDLGVGSLRLQLELDEYHNSSWYREQEDWYQNQYNYFYGTPNATFDEKNAFLHERKVFSIAKNERQDYVNRISDAESDTLYKIAMWNMTNEICRDLGIEEVTSEQFVQMIKQISLKERHQTPQLLAGASYLRGRDDAKGLEGQRYPNSWGYGRAGYMPIAGFIQNTSENLGKNPFTLKKEDIPYIIASYTNKATKDLIPVAWDSTNKLGLEHAIEHAFINDPTTSKDNRKEFNLGIYLEMYQRNFVRLWNNRSFRGLGEKTREIKREI